MKTRITLNTYRRIGRLEETMIRAAMPRTSARDGEALEPFGGGMTVAVLVRRAGANLVKPLRSMKHSVIRMWSASDSPATSPGPLPTSSTACNRPHSKVNAPCWRSTALPVLIR